MLTSTSKAPGPTQSCARHTTTSRARSWQSAAKGSAQLPSLGLPEAVPPAPRPPVPGVAQQPPASGLMAASLWAARGVGVGAPGPHPCHQAGTLVMPAGRQAAACGPPRSRHAVVRQTASRMLDLDIVAARRARGPRSETRDTPRPSLHPSSAGLPTTRHDLSSDYGCLARRSHVPASNGSQSSRRRPKVSPTAPSPTSAATTRSVTRATAME